MVFIIPRSVAGERSVVLEVLEQAKLPPAAGHHLRSTISATSDASLQA